MKRAIKVLEDMVEYTRKDIENMEREISSRESYLRKCKAELADSHDRLNDYEQSLRLLRVMQGPDQPEEPKDGQDDKATP